MKTAHTIIVTGVTLVIAAAWMTAFKIGPIDVSPSSVSEKGWYCELVGVRLVYLSVLPLPF